MYSPSFSTLLYMAFCTPMPFVRVAYIQFTLKCNLDGFCDFTSIFDAVLWSVARKCYACASERARARPIWDLKRSKWLANTLFNHTLHDMIDMYIHFVRLRTITSSTVHTLWKMFYHTRNVYSARCALFAELSWKGWSKRFANIMTAHGVAHLITFECSFAIYVQRFHSGSESKQSDPIWNSMEFTILSRSKWWNPPKHQHQRTNNVWMAESDGNNKKYIREYDAN